MTTIKYTDYEARPKSVKFTVLDGDTALDIILPRNGLFVNTKDQTVTHDLIEQKLRQARDEGKTADLGELPNWVNDAKTSFGYDIDFVLDDGDPELSKTQIRVFVPEKFNEPRAIPMWLVHQAVDRQAPAGSKNQPYTLRSPGGDPIAVSDPVVPEAAA